MRADIRTLAILRLFADAGVAVDPLQWRLVFIFGGRSGLKRGYGVIAAIMGHGPERTFAIVKRNGRVVVAMRSDFDVLP